MLIGGVEGVTNVSIYKSSDPLKFYNILAFTKVKYTNAIHVNNNKAESALETNLVGKMFPLNNFQRVTPRNKLSEVKLLIAHGNKIVSSELFCQINQHCIKICCFGCTYL